MLTSNLRELQYQLVDDGSGVLHPASRANQSEWRPRAKSVHVKLKSSSEGSDGSFRIRIPALPAVQVGKAPTEVFSLEQYQIYSEPTDPDQEAQYDDDQQYDEGWADRGAGEDQGEYGEEYYHDAKDDNENDGWDGYQLGFEPTDQYVEPPSPPKPVPLESPRTPPRVGRWRFSPRTTEKRIHLT